MENTKPLLDRLYRLLEEFIAEIPREEWEEHKDAFKEVQTLIHQKMGKA